MQFSSPKRHNSLIALQVTGSSFISPDDAWGLWSSVATSAALGRSLSGPVCAMLISAILTNLNILPADGSIHLTQLQSFVVKLATPMLLFNADLKKIYRESGQLLQTFLLGTCGTLFGSFFAFILLRPLFFKLGILEDIWKILGALTAKNIGGGLNFMAVVNTLQISPQMVSIALAVDNIMGLLYFPMISWLGTRFNRHQQQLMEEEKEHSKQLITQPDTAKAVALDVSHPLPATPATSSTASIASASSLLEDTTPWITSLAYGLVIATLSDRLASWLQHSSALHLTLPSMVISTLLTVILATWSGSSGKVMRLLPASIILPGNAAGNLAQTLASPIILPLLSFVFLLYSIHLAVVLGIGRLLCKYPIDDLLLASNANIGNAATASAFAQGMNWQKKLVPAMLIGNLGNLLGTFAGFWLATMILKPLCRL